MKDIDMAYFDYDFTFLSQITKRIHEMETTTEEPCFLDHAHLAGLELAGLVAGVIRTPLSLIAKVFTGIAAFVCTPCATKGTLAQRVVDYNATIQPGSNLLKTILLLGGIGSNTVFSCCGREINTDIQGKIAGFLAPPDQINYMSVPLQHQDEGQPKPTPPTGGGLDYFSIQSAAEAVSLDGEYSSEEERDGEELQDVRSVAGDPAGELQEQSTGEPSATANSGAQELQAVQSVAGEPNTDTQSISGLSLVFPRLKSPTGQLPRVPEIL